jgi:hypothetical protein
MRRLVLFLAVVVGALVAAPVALADGPGLVSQVGAGVASHDGAYHYVVVPNGKGGTLLEKIQVARTQVYWWLRLRGSWGTPTIGYDAIGQGLSRDGRTLVLASTSGPYVSPSTFLVVDPRHAKVLRTIALRGAFSFDALSPNGARLYLIQYTHGANDLNHYIVRGYDMRTGRLMSGKIADRAEHEETMAGSALTRTTSPNGRWVYTLYQKPSGESFVHALDTVAGAAYCVDLPENSAPSNIVLSLRDSGRSLALDWRSGRHWLNVATGTWAISYPSSGFPWPWVGGGVGGGLPLLAAGALLVRRRRGEELQKHAGQELGLA